MEKMSAQLADLSARVAKAEDVIAAAQDRDRQRLEAQRAQLQNAVHDGREHAAAVGSWWAQTRSSADDWFAAQREKASRRRAECDEKKADRLADEAEADAADAVDFAMYALDQAEYAIIDAALARAEADARAGD